MGKSFSKIESTKDIKIESDGMVELKYVKSSNALVDADDLKDPRSPHPYNLCRTPINEFSELKTAEIQTNSFKKRLLQTLKLNPFDPRSPSNIINRTPIVFDANESDSTNTENFLSLNDTFSDLFIESRTLRNYGEQFSNIEPASKTLIDKSEEVQVNFNDVASCSDTSSKLNVSDTDPILNERDPRSPFIEVNRTPIVFEDEESENNELEKSTSIIFEDDESVKNRLEKSSSIVFENDESVNNELESMKFYEEKPKHKLVERVKNPPKCKTRSSSRLAAKNYKSKINNENISYPTKHALSSTPKRNAKQLNEKRTPLGCVGNKSHLRPKSNENSTNKKFFTGSPGLNTISSSENQTDLEA